MKTILLLTALTLFAQPVFAQSAVETALKEYAGKENLTFSAERGKNLFYKKSLDEEGQEIQCVTCHTTDLTKQGKHKKTGKVIEPLAPSVNKERFTDLKKIRKWFKRNCKGTFGRECTNQEKGDILSFLSQL